MCPGACTEECTCEGQPFCGDGILDPGEECDDGNNEDGDGCSSSCEVEEMGGEGCTPGYWKQPHHFDSWVTYAPTDVFNTVFGTSISFNVKKCDSSDPTLLQALRCRGGGRNALARHATAALLNAASGGVDFGYDTSGVIMIVKDAIDSGDRDEMLAAKDLLAGLNEQGCPLN
jgi:cysteine-rich repeat protein